MAEGYSSDESSLASRESSLASRETRGISVEDSDMDIGLGTSRDSQPPTPSPSESSPLTFTLLDRLKSPTPSDLARKRKRGSKPPVGGKGWLHPLQSQFLQLIVSKTTHVGRFKLELR